MQGSFRIPVEKFNLWSGKTGFLGFIGSAGDRIERVRLLEFAQVFGEGVRDLTFPSAQGDLGLLGVFLFQVGEGDLLGGLGGEGWGLERERSDRESAKTKQEGSSANEGGANRGEKGKDRKKEKRNERGKGRRRE
jgi:hypothetical protein